MTVNIQSSVVFLKEQDQQTVSEEKKHLVITLVSGKICEVSLSMHISTLKH